MKGRATCVTCAIFSVLLIGVAFPSPAGAWRSPTPREKRVITRLAKRTPHAGSPRKKLHVDFIRVSTVGPWALAGVTLYLSHERLDAYAFLHKIHHRWHLSHGSGHDVSCGTGMPHRVKVDLEVPC